MGEEGKEQQDQQVDQDLDAAFDRLQTGSFPVPDASAKDLPADINTDCMELQAQVAEMQTRLSLMEQSHAVLVKERDAADEARQKLEKTLAEFLTRFAAVRDTQAAAFKEINKLKAERRETEGQFAGVKEQFAAAEKARDDALAAVDLERAAAAAARDELNRFRDTAVASLEPLGREHSRSMKELAGEAEALLTEAQQVRQEATQRLDKLEHVLAEFKTRVDDTRNDMKQRLAAVLGNAADQSGPRPATPPDAPKADGMQAVVVAGHVV